MSDYQDRHPASEANPVRLQICLLSSQQQLSARVDKLLNNKHFELKCFGSIENLVSFALANYEQIDCLVLSLSDRLDVLWSKLWQSEILLPTVILIADSGSLESENTAEQQADDDREFSNIYHQAEIQLYSTQLREINAYINLAINKFISLASNTNKIVDFPTPESKTTVRRSLIAQQRRLTKKLQKRLGHIGFFHQRNPELFWLNLSSSKQIELIDEIKQGYRRILLLYFDDDSEISKSIDEFVDRAFFANISTSQILEIHMDLMDDFAYQLQIEGRNDDILLDYRLPLIDIISHLCETYRRSIPNTDTSMNLLFAVE